MSKLEISMVKLEAIFLKRGIKRGKPIGKNNRGKPNTRHKTIYIRTLTAGRNPKIKLKNNNIRFKNRVKYLGVVIEDSLKFESHCEYIKGKVLPIFI